MKAKKILKVVDNAAVLLLAGLLGLSFMHVKSSNTTAAETLEQGFITPPESAKIRVWWHWMNGNITKEGIRADLEWMKRSGIGGFQNFDAGLSTPQVVDKRLIYMTPEWKDAFLFTTKLADSLGLEMAIAGSPGWSESGGPWVKPGEAMKKYVWSETRIEGGKPYTGMLPKPPSVMGSFQNIKRGGRNIDQDTEFFADAAVIAWRMPDNYASLQDLKPVITSSGGAFTLAELTDGDLVKTSPLPAAEEGKNAWIQFEFSRPVTMQALSIVAGGLQREERSLEASNDGKAFFKVIDIPQGRTTQRTLSFEPITAKFFRVIWKRLPAVTTPARGGGAPPPVQRAQIPTNRGYDIAELVLYPDGRVNRFEEKAGFSTSTDLYNAFTPAINPADAVKRTEVLNITDKMSADGMLRWTPPAGKWKVMRLGFSLTGAMNSPASPEATGLEVDKLSAKHVTSYFTQYLDQYKNATQGLMGKRGLQYVITDSWEAGTLNWTDDMISEFRKRRGYDMTPWLPVLSGQIIESAEASDKFLWDFRKTIIDLTTENHYDLLTTLLKQRGMGRYTESHEGGRAFVGEGMEVKRKADVAMSAFWTPSTGGSQIDINTSYQADIRESASVAHVYGQNLVAAESLTAPSQGPWWSWAPGTLKPFADYALYCGLNRFVIHTSVHQPSLEKAPGLGLGPYGQWFTRHETWAEQAIYWSTYLARSCFMLQQGKYVADIAYYYGEDNNITALFGGRLPDIPKEYSFDFVNADVLVNLMSVDNGSIVTPSGMRYRLLLLDSNSRYMTLPVLRKIKDMVQKGAVVSGFKPVLSPSLADNTGEFNAIVRQLWAKEGVNPIGKGIVYNGLSLPDVLSAQIIIPDFSYIKPQDDSNLFFVHRKVDDVDIYWVSNHNNRVEDISTTFRISGMEPELWHPVTGIIEKVSYTIDNGVTKIPMHFEPLDAVFVVFRNKTDVKSFTVPETIKTQLTTVEGEWNVTFQAGRGAPNQAVFESLTQWNDHTDKGIKYFSGAATYSKTVQAPAEWFTPGAQLWLDLGIVYNLAEVIVNGKSLGVVWTKPFKVNVTGTLKQGSNNLEIKVINAWANRLIGDRQPDAEKYTFTTLEPYTAESPLFPSGLIGPVTFYCKRR